MTGFGVIFFIALALFLISGITKITLHLKYDRSGYRDKAVKDIIIEMVTLSVAGIAMLLCFFKQGG
jgi:hypothetical protein